MLQEGYVPPNVLPDLEALKAESDLRKKKHDGETESGDGPSKAKKAKTAGSAGAAAGQPCTRLFVGNLPFIVNAEQIEATITGTKKKGRWQTRQDQSRPDHNIPHHAQTTTRETKLEKSSPFCNSTVTIPYCNTQLYHCLYAGSIRHTTTGAVPCLAMPCHFAILFTKTLHKVG
jgi:hypothetical protein